jgi:hypothetical protein
MQAEFDRLIVSGEHFVRTYTPRGSVSQQTSLLNHKKYYLLSTLPRILNKPYCSKFISEANERLMKTNTPITEKNRFITLLLKKMPVTLESKKRFIVVINYIDTQMLDAMMQYLE